MALAQTLLVGLGLASIANANFYIGSLSGDTLNSGPWQSPMCNYVAYKDGDDICTAGNFPTTDNSGGCPGENLDPPNFCGSGLAGLGCPDGYQLDTDSPCASGWVDDDRPGNGMWYANVIDTANADEVTGFCQYQYDGENDCSDVITNLVGETIIYCEMVK